MPQADLAEQLCGVLARLAFRLAEQTAEPGRAGQLQTQRHVVEHRQVREHRIALKHYATAGIRLIAQGRAVQRDQAATGGFLAQQQAQKGRLAAARRADQRAELAFGHVQVEALEHHLIGVLLPDIAHTDKAHTRAPSYQGKARRVRAFRPQSISQASRVIHTT